MFGVYITGNNALYLCIALICGLQALVVNSTVATLHVFLIPNSCVAVCPSQVMYMPYETMSQ